ncbi:MAG: sulfur oxidation c-type cytochrome SoxA [Rhodospirillales bacterium]|nr:sulfur oxidation c-type cytochrome SoxA [Rhodospirillales bacterium]
MIPNTKRFVIAGVFVAGAFGLASCADVLYPPVKWESKALPEAQGKVEIKDGKPQHVRYKEGPFSGVRPDFSQFRTQAYDDHRPEPAIRKVAMPKDLKGNAAEGRKIYMNRGLGPCTGCHLIRGDDVWPAGNIGPDHQKLGDAGYSDDELYQMIYDIRAVYPESIMPPWGSAGILTPQQIVHVVEFLKTQKGDLPPEKDPQRDPNTRAKPVGFGDPLDPTNNPALLAAESAEKDWARKGPKGKACADCHQGGVEKAMKGVATRYPRYVGEYRRIMAMEDFLQSHSPATTGIDMPSQSDINLNMSMLVKLQSNGMPLNLDLTSLESRAALKRGEATFNKRSGQRNHACADCHLEEPGKGGNKFLGGRLLATLESGMMNHFPLWRTNFTKVWDPRKRFQWCMTPLGMNYLAADSVEYAELEFYLSSFGQGKPLTAPGIRH